MKKILFAFCLLASSSAFAEVKEIVVSKQYGLGYLPMIVLEEQKLIERHAKAAGLGDVKTTWTTINGGNVANDALLSGNIHLVGGGLGPFIRLWDKTKGKAKALAALNEAPVTLVSNNPKVKTVKDLTERDRIAVPAAKVSMQALVLQMATAREWGQKSFDKNDTLTVSMKNPDAYVALTNGNSEVTGHIGLEPYGAMELERPNTHQVFSSFDLFGRHTTNLIWTTEDFYKQNPKLSRAVVKALDEANAWIVAHPTEAVALYLSAYKSKESPELIGNVLKTSLTFKTKPLPNITQFSDFLFATGATKTRAGSWKDLFFDAVH